MSRPAGTSARNVSLPCRRSSIGYYAYFGTWDVDEQAQTVTHHVRASLRSGEVESDYTRPYELSGEQLLFRYPVSAPDGEGRTRVLIWRRAERF